jgi:hypothetical protein
LVACLVGETGGFVIHIGDGALIGGVTQQKGKVIYLDKKNFISEPQNGEYANETYFITEGNWVKNLRITPLPALDWMILGTDGGGAFYLNPSNNLKQDFISSFIADLFKKNPLEWSVRIEEVLKDEQANKITNDDKTMVLLVKKDLVDPTVDIAFLTQNNRTEEKVTQHQDNEKFTDATQIVEVKKKSGLKTFIPTIKKISIFIIIPVIALVIYLILSNNRMVFERLLNL